MKKNTISVLILCLTLLSVYGNVSLVSDSLKPSLVSPIESQAYMNFISKHLTAASEDGQLHASTDCTSALSEYANNFTAYAGVVGQMVYYSGQDINDLGK